jgi:DNA-binding transcriptional ArsR family regulator
MLTKLVRGPATIQELTKPFDVSQQMISKHVAALVRAQIVVKKKRGRESVCSLNPRAIEAVADWALAFRRLWEDRFDQLDAVLHEMKQEESNRAP